MRNCTNCENTTTLIKCSVLTGTVHIVLEAEKNPEGKKFGFEKLRVNHRLSEIYREVTVTYR